METLTSLEIIVLSKAIKDKMVGIAREKLEAKPYSVDMTVNIKGDITVNPDEPYIPTIAVPLKPVLALFIRYCGITRDAAVDNLIKAMTEALNDGQVGDETARTVKAAISAEEQIIADCEARVTAAMEALPLKRRKGKILTNLTVTAV